MGFMGSTGKSTNFVGVKFANFVENDTDQTKLITCPKILPTS